MGMRKTDHANEHPRRAQGWHETLAQSGGDTPRAGIGVPRRIMPAEVKAPARKTLSPAIRPSRADKSAFRREAILAAALEEFAARGFAAARLEDMATRAGVGKGTIYLHFRDKEALFQELVTTMLVPFIANLEAPPPAGLPIRMV